ncbi:MAG: N-acetylglucosaminyl-phosphatidylinositol de-N-acetylase [Tremellales sp. Tagirdzhanova-0007]|nr:MAG: N-acetylglucosaminyl-phosphatidylinositol de-N-acetylase [Tremellales sp. Tagirdzhanova-0007]
MPAATSYTLPFLLTALTLIIAILLHFPPPPTDFDHLLPEPSSPRTALVLSAHPDDESMFFSPTIISLVSSGWSVRALCLSSGNDSGLGMEREKELFASYEVLGLERDDVDLVDHPGLQDSPLNIWDPRLIASLVASNLAKHPVSLLITFDEDGISRHPNHMALHVSLAHLLLLPISPPTKILKLRSPPIHEKYTGPLFSISYSLSHHIPNITRGLLSGRGDFPRTVVVIASPGAWWKGVRAMIEHRTQLLLDFPNLRTWHTGFIQRIQVLTPGKTGLESSASSPLPLAPAFVPPPSPLRFSKVVTIALTRLHRYHSHPSALTCPTLISPPPAFTCPALISPPRSPPISQKNEPSVVQWSGLWYYLIGGVHTFEFHSLTLPSSSSFSSSPSSSSHISPPSLPPASSPSGQSLEAPEAKVNACRLVQWEEFFGPLSVLFRFTAFGFRQKTLDDFDALNRELKVEAEDRQRAGPTAGSRHGDVETGKVVGSSQEPPAETTTG